MKKSMDKITKAKAEEIVKNLVREHLPKAEVVKVKIIEDVGWDGDDILRVHVIHDSERYVLNSDGTLGFGYHLSQELSKIDIDASPVMSWILAKEVGLGRKRARPKRKRAGIAA